MRRKLMAFLLAGALVFGLAACSRNVGADRSTPSRGVPRPGGSAETRGAKNPDDVKVTLVCGGAVNDGGWNASAYEGLQRIEETLGVETAYTEKVAVADATGHPHLRPAGL